MTQVVIEDAEGVPQLRIRRRPGHRLEQTQRLARPTLAGQAGDSAEEFRDRGFSVQGQNSTESPGIVWKSRQLRGTRVAEFTT